MMMVISTYRF